MPPIKIACSGYPVGQKKYQSRLNAVELRQMFDGVPKSNTIERWKAQARDGFEFIPCVPEDVTHARRDLNERGGHRFGHFQDTPEVNAAYRAAKLTAIALGARSLFFQLPRTMAPQADHVNRLHRFFSKADRGDLRFVWEPPASWPSTLVASLSKTLRLSPAHNPLSGRLDIPTPIRYFRLGAGGKTAGLHHFTDDELSRVKKACDGGPAYVVFNNGPHAFDDAVRFASMIY